MKTSSTRMLTTHAGLLYGTDAFQAIETIVRRGGNYDRVEYEKLRADAVVDVVRKQVEIGLDLISDGELGKSRGYPYYSRRMSGIAERPLKPGEVAVTVRKTRETERFRAFYDALERTMDYSSVPPGKRMVCVGPLIHKDLADLHRELANFKAALAKVSVTEAFIPVLAPGWLDHFLWNEHYATEEEFIFALAEVLRPEYEAVVEAGFILQIDDPGLTDAWPTFFPEPPIDQYRKSVAMRVEALNHALRNIAEDRVRYHVCWGSYHGPHIDDLPLRDIVDLMLSVRAQAYSIEAANPRHEHEWKIWRETKLPDDKILIPGVVSHATNTIEHPELVADRIVRFANVVGRERVIAGTDCGMGGGRVHAQIGWAKLRAMVEGARLATQQLWP